MPLTPSQAIKETFLEMIRDMRDNALSNPVDKGDMDLIEFFVRKLDAIAMVEKIKTELVPRKVQVANQDISFVDINSPTSIFGMLPIDRRTHLKDMLSGKKKGLSEEDRQVFFSYLERIIEIAEKKAL